MVLPGITKYLIKASNKMKEQSSVIRNVLYSKYEQETMWDQ